MTLEADIQFIEEAAAEPIEVEPEAILESAESEAPLPKPDELWHTPSREAWASIGGWHYPVQSEAFRSWLAQKLFERDREAANKGVLDKLVGSYAATACWTGLEYPVHLRTAETRHDHQTTIWLDLADEKGRAVRITRAGWGVVSPPQVPVKFFRPSNIRTLPKPLREEADADHLRLLLNLPSEESFRLLLTWLSFALLPERPYPILAVSGPAGAAKTSFAKFVRNTIDPSAVPCGGMPRGQDLVAVAKNHAILCFDNLSTMNGLLSDDLCRLATGGGLGGRKLYTNDDDASFNASRPMILTGLNDVATRGDLADRTLVFHLLPIPVGNRRTDEEIREAFEYAHPRVLAALLDAVVMGLQRREKVQARHHDLERMADFTLWGYAVAPALGWTEDDFRLAYRASQQAARSAVIEGDPVATGIIELLSKRSCKQWEGATTMLWAMLRSAAGEAARARNFPRNPVALGRRLVAIEPALRSHGVVITRQRLTAGTQITLQMEG